MKMKGLIVSMGIGAAAGAVAVMMLPKESSARKLAGKAADKVEDAAKQVAAKIGNKMQ